MEIRKDIKWYEWLYQVSNLWNIKRMSRNTKSCYWSVQLLTEKIMSNQIMKNWYEKIWLVKEWKTKRFRTHRLVAEAFIPNPENKETVNHKNWIRNDNRAENLERNTTSENLKHSFRELWRKNEWCKYWASAKSKAVYQYTKEWAFLRKYDSVSKASDIMWINASSIASCARWKIPSAWWYNRNYFIS